ncbi:hypothetical protein ABN306_15310 [Providencia huaxiensis]|uniref:Uncharacterized protein n=1 Tax=Providencia huaxiensis TaxID=2027290 RepID=A0ABU2IT27_9GAMM|nr:MULTISPECIES: hypothetical protein [Providencia]MBZ3682365.1 hypothetical protein [Providencia rettgeri]MCD2530311.1 hypothetical protein [Providencia huaxiensis]MDT0132216.1 hypothetical protein [Providencia huaxiensis]MDT1978622.1 hypothetical protein [Providencia huaxiensis]QLR01746.1 hypothetical protein H0912_02940 [Providencia rettgeri]
MRNTLTSRHQRNNRTIDEVEVNAMSNSMAMLLIYHGLPAGLGKPHSTSNSNTLNKPTR